MMLKMGFARKWVSYARHASLQLGILFYWMTFLSATSLQQGKSVKRIICPHINLSYVPEVILNAFIYVQGSDGASLIFLLIIVFCSDKLGQLNVKEIGLYLMFMKEKVVCMLICWKVMWFKQEYPSFIRLKQNMRFN